MAKKDEVTMVRLRNIKSGALVEVPDEKVARLGSEWEPASATKASTAKASTAKKPD